jgi:3-oxoadipate enol-lactonase
MAHPGLFYRDEGPRDAPPVVLLHSLATHGELWALQQSVWRASFRVLCMDLPGHGRSSMAKAEDSLEDIAAQVLATLDSLGVVRASFVGMSLGGMVAQAIALNWPDRVESLVLAHCGARTDAAVKRIWDQRIKQVEDEGVPAQVHPTLERWFPREFASASPITLQWVAEMIRQTSKEGYVSAIRAIQGLDHLERLHHVKAPTLVVAGDEDIAVSPAMASALAQGIPDSELLILEGTGHLGNVQSPHRFSESVGNFISRHLSC